MHSCTWTESTFRKIFQIRKTMESEKKRVVSSFFSGEKHHHRTQPTKCIIQVMKVSFNPFEWFFIMIPFSFWDERIIQRRCSPVFSVHCTYHIEYRRLGGLSPFLPRKMNYYCFFTMTPFIYFPFSMIFHPKKAFFSCNFPLLHCYALCHR